MSQSIQDPKRSLYEEDTLRWSEETAAKLKVRDFDNLDLENLIEEVEELGRYRKKELLSRLTRLLEHLLKRLYVDLPQDYRGWEQTIRNQRTELEFLIEDSPSLKYVWFERFNLAWKFALKTVQEDYPNVDFPDRFPYPTDVDTLLNKKYWETEQ
jgi:hypothetical protein